MPTPFEKDQIVYDERGTEFEVVELTNTGLIVRRVYESDEGPVWGEPFLAAFQLYASEVAPKISATVAELEKQAITLREELTQLRREREDARRADDYLFKTLKNHAAVRDLVDFIHGKAQFLAYSAACEWHIEPMETALKGDERNGSLRLLALYGGSKGDLTWRRHSYSDGSGNNYQNAQPALTYDDALVFVRAQIIADLEERRVNIASGTSDHMAHYVVRNMEKFDMPVPDYVRESADRAIAKQREHEIATARKEIARFQNVLTGYGVE